MTIETSLKEFYKKNNFKTDGGEKDAYFSLKFKFFSIKLPNFSFRKKVIYIHDIQHIVHQKDTSWKGEAFIAGWEIGTKMWKHFPIGVLSLWAMGFSILNYPKEVLKGYKKGLKNRGILDLNLEKEVILSKTLEELKTTITYQNPKPFYLLTFLFWCLVSLLIFLFPILLIITLLLF